MLQRLDLTILHQLKWLTRSLQRTRLGRPQRLHIEISWGALVREHCISPDQQVDILAHTLYTIPLLCIFILLFLSLPSRLWVSCTMMSKQRLGLSKEPHINNTLQTRLHQPFSQLYRHFLLIHTLHPHTFRPNLFHPCFNLLHPFIQSCAYLSHYFLFKETSGAPSWCEWNSQGEICQSELPLSSVQDHTKSVSIFKTK